MTEHAYVPGAGTALVGQHCAVLLSADVDPEMVAALWPLVRDGADVDVLLEQLAAQGMRRMGPFALLAGQRVVLRGAGASVDAAGRRLTAEGLTTWAEHVVERAEGVRLELSGEAGGRLLPLVGGVVGADAVLLGAGSSGLVPVPASVPVQPSVPAPVLSDSPPEAPAVSSQTAAPAVPVVADPVPVARDAAPSAADTVLPDWPQSDLLAEVPTFGASVVEDTGYDHLFGSTVHRSIEEAAVRPPSEDDAPAALGWAPGADPDHDGSTVMRSALPRRSSAPTGPLVLGLLCPDGHANPPAASVCRSCGGPVADDEPTQVPRPPLGHLRSSDGGVAALDRSVVIGRAPSPQRPSSDEPHLLRVASPTQDISRTHVEVRVEEWDVLVVDVSTNGTRLVRPGREPQLLHRGEPVVVLPGSVLDLGDGVTVAFEAAS